MATTQDLLPRESLLWIFAAQFVALLPQFTQLPLWVPFAWAFAVYWRLEVFRGRRDLPGRTLKLLVIFLIIAGLAMSYRRWFALEPMVALLTVSFTLKNLELVSRRDAFVSLLLAYFVAATLFVREQTIPYALYGLLSVVVITAALAAQMGSFSARPRRALGLSLRLLAQATPLMLLLFVVMPRLGPLWSVPQDTSAGRTGVSDSMAPGDFTRLSKSDKPALRISFDGPIPPPEQRYWRGLVYSEFDGRTWRQGFGVDPRNGGRVYWRSGERPLPQVGPRYRYQVIQEASRTPWLFALARPVSDSTEVGETEDDRLVKRTPVYSRFAYEVRSWPRDTDSVQAPLSTAERRRNLQLPVEGNERTRKWVENLRRRGLGAEQISTQLLARYNREFTYTLRPPALGVDSVDEFLFGSKQGFCEHFAGSYVFAMRAAGVPARVVAGYQGGEWVRGEQYLLVREYDAHAWAEIWLDGRGWQRVDPTAAVAPERVRDGLESAAGEEFMQDSLLPLHRIDVLVKLRLQWDMINYRWYQTVVSFDSERQRDTLQRLLGDVSPLRMALLFALPTVLALLGVLAWIWYSGRRRKLPPAERLYRKFCRRMARAGVKRDAGETPQDYAERIAAQKPRLATLAQRVTDAFERAAYAGESAALSELRQLLRWRLASAVSPAHKRELVGS
ncbi:protein-glutamine gamma-glutamyltransferase [Microbulbifer sp. NBRC 101763]|uniref:transglutaminase TgpA family protein n=1 Tax=Microbulbifer sp. NBRC 101763 TaxID=1113820 RepID=UPI0030B040C5